MKAELLTQADLKALFSYNSETGIFVCICGPRKGKVSGSDSHGYLQISINRKKYLAHRLAWLYVFGMFPARKTDHVNGIKHDNRIKNLRECTDLQNNYNRSMVKTNLSGFKGVRYTRNKTNPWRAYITISGKLTHLGYFATAELANIAYATKAKDHHGEFLHSATASVL